MLEMFKDENIFPSKPELKNPYSKKENLKLPL